METKNFLIEKIKKSLESRTIINDLKYRYKTYTYQDASFQEYGYGATQVTIK